MIENPSSIPAHQLAGPWRKSSASGRGNCVELAGLPGSSVAMRNSRDAAGPALVFTRDEMVAFIAGVRNGEFDDLVH